MSATETSTLICTLIGTSVTAGAVSAAVTGALLCGGAGLLVPRAIARIPPPQDPPQHQGQPHDPAQDQGHPQDQPLGRQPGGAAGESSTVTTEPPPPSFVEVAGRPHLGPLVAVTAAVAGAVVGAALGWSWPLLFWWPTVPVGVLLGYVDLRTRLLPKRVLLPAHGVVLVLALAAAAGGGDWEAYLRALLGMVVARTVFWALWWIHSAGLGFGDVRLSALLGFELAYLGWGELVVGTYASFLVFGLPALVVLVVRRDRALLKLAVPFGPAMLVGSLVGVVVGSGAWAHLVG